MATATFSPETGGTTLKEMGRKYQAGVLTAAQYGVEEVGWFKGLENFETALSQREITFEARLKGTTGATFIAEGGKEARPSSPTAVTATVTFTFLNKRWTISRMTKMILGKQSSRAFIKDQFKWQAMNATDAIRARWGEAFWGFSTGTVAKVSSISTDDVVLKDLHGVSGLGATTHNRQVVDQFVVAASGANTDYICFLNPTGPAIRVGGIVALTAKTRSSNTITCGASGVTALAANDLVVYANSLENTTMASGTERNLALVGILDGMTSASVHSISNATAGNENWAASVANTTGGRLTPVMFNKFRQGIMNKGGGKFNFLIMAQGVWNDFVDSLRAGVRYADVDALEIDGTPKSKGVEIVTSQRVPDTYIFGFDKNNSVRKIVLTPDVDMPGVDEGHKLQDDSGEVFSADFILGMAWTNRANSCYASGLSQQ